MGCLLYAAGAFAHLHILRLTRALKQKAEAERKELQVKIDKLEAEKKVWIMLTLLRCSVVLFALYGACVGNFHCHRKLWT